MVRRNGLLRPWLADDHNPCHLHGLSPSRGLNKQGTSPSFVAQLISTILLANLSTRFNVYYKAIPWFGHG
jgi:hypothetical protein